MAVRRIVTGVNADGRARIISDGEVEGLMAPSLPGTSIHYVWGADRKETVPTDGTPAMWSEHFPPADGYRVIFSTFAPGSVAGRDQPMTPQEHAEAEKKFPGLHSTFSERDAGMHASATVDIAVVLSGRIDLEVDDGEVAHLEAGNFVIQNGTAHKWSNPGDTYAAVAFILMGANAKR